MVLGVRRTGTGRVSGRVAGGADFAVWTSRLVAGTAAVLAAHFVCAQPATAQGFFDSGYSSQSAKAKAKRKRAAARETISRSDATAKAAKAKSEPALSERPVSGPLVLTVSLRRQRLSVFDSEGLVTEAPISSGTIGHATPTGIFSILEKNRVHFSNLYDSAPMPNMQRITWSGVALHAGHLPGYPASHGCIRLPHGFSKKLFEVTKLGTRVIVSQDPLRPQSVAHEALFGIYPEGETVATHALMPQEETRVADASEAGRIPREVGSVIGIAEAHAAEATGPEQAIAALRAGRQQEMQRLSDAIPAAESARDAAIEIARAALALSGEAQAQLKAARAEASRAASEARKAAQAASAADGKLKSFERSMTRKTAFTPEQVAEAARSEDELETRALDLEDAATAARKAADLAATDLVKKETAWKEAETKRATAALEVKKASDAVGAARDAEAAAKRREAKRKAPIHVFISRKTGKIYARQGYEPILEAPITIDNPEQPLGTHVFTALAAEPGQRRMTWSVVSVPSYAAPKQQRPRDRKERAAFDAMMEEAAKEALRGQTASSALDRLGISPDIRMQIEDVMKPGSSLIVSDNGMSNETGKFTDFIVPIR